MENIIEPNEFFDFSKLSLAHPIGIQGGAFFTKIEHNHKSLYIQTPKSVTRQGFVKSGKKYYCDLMFDKHSEPIVHWFENLEEKCRKLIYEKKNDWFQGNLEECDIETAFNAVIRIFKSGKFYLLRANVKNNKDDVPMLKIYDEKQNSMEISEINSDTEIMSILEIQGIKFTSRNFQIEIELKQVMVLDKEPIFEGFMFKTTKSTDELTPISIKDTEKVIAPSKMDVEKAVPIADNVVVEEEPIIVTDYKPLDEIEAIVPNASDNSFDIEFDTLLEEVQTNPDELKEIVEDELPIDNANDSITLKKPNQVYFELYKEAKAKAKQAKKSAIIAYLEAKHIKNTYMLENESDSDFEAELDDVSENELEGL